MKWVALTNNTQFSNEVDELKAGKDYCQNHETSSFVNFQPRIMNQDALVYDDRGIYLQKVNRFEWQFEWQ